jgi:CopG family nickel-responsive transcriptional regulator
MRRLTVSVNDDLADAFDALVQQRGYENRSEAFRDLVRRDLGQVRLAERPAGPCVATLTFLYGFEQRQLTLRLQRMQQEHHDLTVAAVQSHLDHEHCIETMILRGRSDRVQAFAEAVMAQPGVTHGNLHLVPMASRREHGHEHLQPAVAAVRKRSNKAASRA